MKRFASSHQQNFTLIEVLAVIAIIGVLCAIALGLVSLAKTKMAESRTRATIEKVSLALNSLQSKFGYFPNAQGKLFVVSTLDKDPKDLTIEDIDLGKRTTYKDGPHKDKEKSIYPDAYLNGFISIIEFDNLKSSCIRFNGKVVLADGLEHPLLYASPGETNNATFDLASAGVDGYVGNKTKKVDGKDIPVDIVSDLNTDYVKIGDFDPKTSDDIANF